MDDATEVSFNTPTTTAAVEEERTVAADDDEDDCTREADAADVVRLADEVD